MEIHTIGVYELWKMAKRSDVYIVDIREREDYRKFHVGGAYNLPYDEIDRWKNTLPKNKKIVLYCEHGSTSMMAAKQLVRMGYEIYTLVGGARALND